MNTFTAVIHPEDNLFVAFCPEVGSVSQGDTWQQALDNLKIATELYLQEASYTPIGRSIITTFDIAAHA